MNYHSPSNEATQRVLLNHEGIEPRWGGVVTKIHGIGHSKDDWWEWWTANKEITT